MALGILTYPGAPAPGTTDTTPKVALGLTAQAVNDATNPQSAVELVYLKGVASTAVGDVVTYNPATGVTARLVASARGPVAVALAACTAGLYSWYAIRGVVSAKAGTVVSGTPAFACATTAQVDDANVSGDKIDGMTFASADSAGLASVALNYPVLNGNDVSGA
jgi:hypothetical protein